MRFRLHSHNPLPVFQELALLRCPGFTGECIPGTHALVAGANFEDGCCACRQVAAGATATVFGAAPASNGFGNAPDCVGTGYDPPAGDKLPAGRVVLYTGAKLLNYAGNDCTRGSYAQIVMKVRQNALQLLHDAFQLLLTCSQGYPCTPCRSPTPTRKSLKPYGIGRATWYSATGAGPVEPALSWAHTAAVSPAWAAARSTRKEGTPLQPVTTTSAW